MFLGEIGAALTSKETHPQAQGEEETWRLRVVSVASFVVWRGNRLSRRPRQFYGPSIHTLLHQQVISQALLSQYCKTKITARNFPQTRPECAKEWGQRSNEQRGQRDAIPLWVQRCPLDPCCPALPHYIASQGLDNLKGTVTVQHRLAQGSLRVKYHHCPHPHHSPLCPY